MVKVVLVLVLVVVEMLLLLPFGKVHVPLHLTAICF